MKTAQGYRVGEWITMGDAQKLLKVTRPTMVTLVKKYRLEVKTSKMDGRIKLVNKNAVKRLMGV